MLGQGARRALFYNPRLAHEERGAFRERRRLGGVFRRGAVVARGRRLREREELAPLDALRHLDLDAVGAGHDRARRARRHDPGDRLLRPVLRGVDGRGRPLDQESPPKFAAAATAATVEAAAEAGRPLLRALVRERRGDGPLLPKRRDAGRELFQKRDDGLLVLKRRDARREVASEKRRDAGRELLHPRRDVASEPGAPLAELLVARARLVAEHDQQPAEEQEEKERRGARP